MSAVLTRSHPRTAAAPAEPTSDGAALATLAAALPRSVGGRLAISLPSALEALRANKGRAVLTTLGIIIGVGAVIVMVSLGQGASAQVNDRLAGLGTNVLTIMPGSAQSGEFRLGPAASAR